MSIGYEAFVQSLEDPTPPVTVGNALRALWFDARGEAESAHRAAHGDDSHGCLRARAYLARKAGDEREAQRRYYYAAVRPWPGSLASAWEDIARSVLVEQLVEQAYT